MTLKIVNVNFSGGSRLSAEEGTRFYRLDYEC